MPEPPKIALSEKELLMLQDAEWILTKQRIIEKVSTLLSAMVPEINQAFHPLSMLSMEIRASVPKISKGEQYLGLPYVILDYPRVFDHDDVFALRTMFWWGNFFSITLQLSGKYKQLLSGAFRRNLTSDKGLYIGINQDPWQHHFEASNYRLAERMTTAEQTFVFEELETVKIALRYDLKEWNLMPELLTSGYKIMAGLLEVSYRDGERGLSPGIPKVGSDL